ncbi:MULTISPECIES: hypothetical protein [unclassified Serratia (in: enterobacteria)]|uniref:hypothetical protein n=1 Tax=unclassified Serratia (in: enterobacteria) TaxID=2647522 RepID=UPI003076268F
MVSVLGRILFKRELSFITVNIDGIDYTFKLTNKFWNSCPEFRDPAITNQDSAIKNYIIESWLKNNFEIFWKYKHPPNLKLMQYKFDEPSFKILAE